MASYIIKQLNKEGTYKNNLFCREEYLLGVVENCSEKNIKKVLKKLENKFPEWFFHAIETHVYKYDEETIVDKLMLS